MRSPRAILEPIDPKAIPINTSKQYGESLEGTELTPAGLQLRRAFKTALTTGTAIVLQACGGGGSTTAIDGPAEIGSIVGPIGNNGTSAGLGSTANGNGVATVPPGPMLVSPSSSSTSTSTLPSGSNSVSTVHGATNNLPFKIAINKFISFTDREAARFLGQASMGASRDEVDRLKTLGPVAWLDAQFAAPATMPRLTQMNTGLGNFDASVLFKAVTSPDTLRQRITLMLSEIFVVSVTALPSNNNGNHWGGVTYFDLLEANAFGNVRTLLREISTSSAMGYFLTFINKEKANPVTGSHPDENYARELMQLFTLGVVKLNQDGTPILNNGVVQDTYTQNDVENLARIFTGWIGDTRTLLPIVPGDFPLKHIQSRPMIQDPVKHETGASTFLGATVPAGLSGEAALDRALDIIFNHPNVAPFLSKQFIKKLVTSNPSPAYVGRVAAVFKNDGNGVAGNLTAIVKAILLDTEALQLPAGTAANTAGKLREPFLRLMAWARAASAYSSDGSWVMVGLGDAGGLGQVPGRATSVFNFFRPDYVPPNTGIANAGLVGPEFQMVNETSVINYYNTMDRIFSGGFPLRSDYTHFLPLAADAQKLVEEINTLMAAGQLRPETVTQIVDAIASMPPGPSEAPLRYRVYNAFTLVAMSPDFLIQK